MQEIMLNEPNARYRRILIYLVDVTDGFTPETGITASAGEIKIAKLGATTPTHANHAGTLTELGLGLYYYTFAVAECNTTGVVSFNFTDAAARAFVKEVQITVRPPVGNPNDRRSNS